MSIRSKGQIIITGLIVLIVAFITIKLSGHVHSLGILLPGLLVIDLFAVFIGIILYVTRLLELRAFSVLTGAIAGILFLFIFYHRSYDSYHETRSIFWGLNGERENVIGK